MAIIKESGRERSKALTILETIQNQNYTSISSLEKEKVYKDDDIGLRNFKAGNKIKLLANGDVAIKDIKNNGIYINKQKSSILLSSKIINLNSEYLNIKTRPDGLRINGYYLNPEAMKISIGDIPLFIKLDGDYEFEDLLREFEII